MGALSILLLLLLLLRLKKMVNADVVGSSVMDEEQGLLMEAMNSCEALRNSPRFKDVADECGEKIYCAILRERLAVMTAERDAALRRAGIFKEAAASAKKESAFFKKALAEVKQKVAAALLTDYVSLENDDDDDDTDIHLTDANDLREEVHRYVDLGEKVDVDLREEVEVNVREEVKVDVREEVKVDVKEEVNVIEEVKANVREEVDAADEVDVGVRHEVDAADEVDIGVAEQIHADVREEVNVGAVEVAVDVAEEAVTKEVSVEKEVVVSEIWEEVTEESGGTEKVENDVIDMTEEVDEIDDDIDITASATPALFDVPASAPRALSNVSNVRKSKRLPKRRRDYSDSAEDWFPEIKRNHYSSDEAWVTAHSANAKLPQKRPQGVYYNPFIKSKGKKWKCRQDNGKYHYFDSADELFSSCFSPEEAENKENDNSASRRCTSPPST